MQTVFRLKRRLEDSPSDSLLLNCCKKQKLDTASGSESLSTVLQFSGTQESQNDDLLPHVHTIKEKLKENLIKKPTDETKIRQRLREEARERSTNDRYKIVNCLRSDLSEDNPVTVVDIEPEESGETASDRKYVYDIYYTDAAISEEVADYDIDILPRPGFTMFFPSDDEEDKIEDDEDSNDENNYKNDYPDESDDDDFKLDDMVSDMDKLGFDSLSENDLSSDEDGMDHYGEVYSKAHKHASALVNGGYSRDLVETDSDGESSVDCYMNDYYESDCD